jgi:ribosomal protein S18 acetylase RimI-like enzyme
LNHLLDNIIWNTLSGAHGRFSAGTEEARRYLPGFSPIMAFADTVQPNFAAIAPYCEPGEHIHCDVWTGPVPEGWSIAAESTMFRMVWDGGAQVADEAPDAVLLGPEHAERVWELVAATNPGPFGVRALELGDYFGYFDGPRLVSMAGERFQAGNLREISGVCTHPGYRGRGLARGLMTKLIHRQLTRDEVPFLHVIRHNERARGVYTGLGFREYREVVVRVMSRA